MIRDTNFLDELFTDDELNADNIKDREGKMKFLQKLIDVVSEWENRFSELIKYLHFNYRNRRTERPSGEVVENCGWARGRKDK